MGDLTEAKATVIASKANVEQAKLNLEFCEVRAPVDGRVGRAMVTVGNLVQGATAGQATVLSELVSIDRVYVYFDPPERDVLRFRRTLSADGPAGLGGVAVEVGLFDETGYPHKGVVDFVAERLESGTGTQAIRAVLPNPGHSLLSEGMFARVRVAFSKPYKGLVVAERAIVTVQGGKCLYVVNAEGVVEERTVDVGRIVSPGLRQIKAGLNPGDRVAVANLQRMMPGAKVNPSVGAMPVPPGT